MDELKNFLRNYCLVSEIHYSKVIDLWRLYKTDKEKYKVPMSRVLTCYNVYKRREEVHRAVKQELDAVLRGYIKEITGLKERVSDLKHENKELKKGYKRFVCPKGCGEVEVCRQDLDLVCSVCGEELEGEMSGVFIRHAMDVCKKQKEET